MSDHLTAISYKDLRPTRDFIQDIAKVIGKAQQVVLPVDPNDWQRGLLVAPKGLSSQTFNDLQIVLDLEAGTVQAGQQTWNLNEISPQQLLQALGALMQAEIEKPDLATTISQFDATTAAAIRGLFEFGKTILEQAKATIKSGVTSPILLYPHHFDLSLVWYPDRQTPHDTSKDKQYTFGLSTGDNDVAEPYFYVTNYPEHPDFTKQSLPTPAFWQHDGFSGAIFKYNDVTKQGNPIQAVQQFFQATIS